MGPEEDHDTPRFRASQAAHESIEHFSRLSKLQVVKERIHPVAWEDLKQHQLLGKGAFSEVYRVDINTTEMRGKRCALKYLKPTITDKTEGDFDLAAIDLAMEANLLSRLNHENIIELHGIYSGELKSCYADSERGYFLLLDQLQDTLPKHLERARAKERRRILSNSVSSDKILDRLKNIALGVSKGLEYLHSNQIIFRDLKPDNIGFTQRGNPVIFDFGFARELHTLQGDEIAGSLRYMSPEMAFGQNPSLPSDVYSFGVLLYELCTLQKPFKRFKERSIFTENVLVGNYRPSIATIPSDSIHDLISSCWDPDPEKRPEMSYVVKVLRVETALTFSRRQSLDMPLDSSGSLHGGPCRTISIGLMRRNSLASSSNFLRRNSVSNASRSSSSIQFSRQNGPHSRRQSLQTEVFGSDASLSEISVSSNHKTDSLFNSSHSSSWSDLSLSALGTLRKPFKCFSRPKASGVAE